MLHLILTLSNQDPRYIEFFFLSVMTTWCTEKIPVEGNFGQTFDKLNDSINRLAEHFTTNVVLKVQKTL